MSKVPQVALVGRTNVGKSTLFNRLAPRVKSIALDQEGVTRDSLKDVVSWQGRRFELVDTGGFNLRKTTDEIFGEIRDRVLTQITNSELVVFVCDGKIGAVSEDKEIARFLHKSGKPVLLVINKIDSNVSYEYLHEFNQLGFKNIVEVSAQHGTGIADLLEEILGLIPVSTEGKEEDDPCCRVVLLGKPNVGKSSLMNLLLDKERSIVADVAGTTREAISESISFYQQDFEVIDTPGIRRQKSVKDTLESLMVKSSLRSVDRADVVLLLVDASSGKLSDQELKLAFYTFAQENKALIILFNKDDLSDDASKYQLEFNLDEYEFLMKKVPSLTISCKSGKNIGKVLPLINKICARYKQTLPEDELRHTIIEAIEHKPLYHKTNLLRIFRVKQVATGPITILLRVNQPEWFGPSQLGYFDNILRKKYDLQGVPLRFFVRKGRK